MANNLEHETQVITALDKHNCVPHKEVSTQLGIQFI
jgi:hypothetical protein